MLRLTRFAIAAVAALLPAACATTQSPAPVTGSRPRLAVVIVVDGLPQRQAVDYRDQFAPDGFERFLTRGAWFTDANYGYATTETAPGHTTIFTGANPRRHGIIANEWMDVKSHAKVYSFGDSNQFPVRHRPLAMEGTSTKNLLVETLADAMRKADPRSKVISVSDKDRSAIPAAGKAGAAYIFHEETGEFDSTTAYMTALPKWVVDFNAAQPARKYVGAEWKPLLPDAAYSRSLPDERPWYGEGGKLPRKLPAQGGARFNHQMMATPFGDDLTLAFARAALEGEQLGRDGSPDLLVVALSSHDYVNHAFGAESRISHDHVLYLDRALQDFLNDLDVAVGRDNYVAVITSDHGFTPAPEHSQSLGRDAGRAEPAKLGEAVNAALVKKYRRGRWVQGWSGDMIVFNRNTLQGRDAPIAEVMKEAKAALLAQPGVADAFTRAEIEDPKVPGTPLLDAVRKSWHPDRSGDIYVVPKPYWLVTGPGKGTTHGSPHPYDTNVPLLWYGPSWIAPGRIDRPVDMIDVAPTLARILGVPAPSGSEGKPLPLETPGGR